MKMLSFLAVWSQVNTTVWEGLGNLALLEVLCHWELALRSVPFFMAFLLPICELKGELWAAALATCFHAFI